MSCGCTPPTGRPGRGGSTRAAPSTSATGAGPARPGRWSRTGAGSRVHVVTPAPVPDPSGAVATADEDGIRVHRVGGDPFATGDWTGHALRRFVRELDREVEFRMFHGFFLSVAQACASAANQP